MKCLWPLVIYSTAWGIVHTLPTDDQMPSCRPRCSRQKPSSPGATTSPHPKFCSPHHFRTKLN